MIEKYLFVGALYVLLILFVYELITKNNSQRLLKKLSGMIDEGVSGIWSATRFIMVESWLLIIGVWAFISLWKMSIQEIPASVVEVLLISATLKYIQKREEGKIPADIKSPDNSKSPIAEVQQAASEVEKVISQFKVSDKKEPDTSN